MLKSLFIMAFAVFGIISTPTQAMEPMADNSKPIMAVFHSDTCGSCKILKPKMGEAMSQLSDKEALKIVRFDLTDEATTAKSAALAGENGLTDLYNKHAPKTGFGILVNDNGHTPMMITKADSVEVIKAKLETFIATK